MSKSVVSFTKQAAQVTPYWVLQQMAAIDAVLIFKFADEIRLHKVRCASRTQACDPAHIAFPLAERAGAAAMGLAGALR